MMRLFLKSAPGLLQTLEEASQNADHGCLQAAAHALGRSSANVGARRFSALAARIERRSTCGRSAELNKQLQRLRDEHRRVEVALKQMLSAA